MDQVSPAPFDCTTEHDGTVATVTPVGELDLATCEELHRFLHEAITKGPEQLTLDLRGVTFLDSTCLSLLLRTQRECATRRVRFQVRRPPEDVQVVFEITRTDDVLPFVD